MHMLTRELQEEALNAVDKLTKEFRALLDTVEAEKEQLDKLCNMGSHVAQVKQQSLVVRNTTQLRSKLRKEELS
jgi:hypothetical protein